MSEREWKTIPLEKFADVRSQDDVKRDPLRRHLPAVLPYRQNSPTEELELRRVVEDRFRIKKSR